MAQDLRARRKELKAELKRKREAALGGRGDQRGKRLLAVVLILILLALLPDCSCNEAPVPGLIESPTLSEPVLKEATVSPPTPETLTGRVARRDRPEYKSESQDLLPWIASFRMQVAARSPRLAECFVGVQRPGTFKWTTAVEPTHGQVSDHTLEPMLLSDTLTRQQRLCVIGVLSDPTYQLEIGDEPSTPSRVGMVIEF